MTDPEQRFLQARQARLTALANNTRKTEEDRHALADFWTALRLRFQNWKERLQQDGLDRQACLDLKEELQALRQECLHPNPHPSSILPVPMNLPAADWRVLHSEFTRYFALWEEVSTTKFPKGKFTFARYRQEVARRKALGIPLEAASAPTLPNPSSPTHQVEEQKDDDATLQDISNAAIYISTDGAVVVNSKDVVDSDQSQETGATTRSALLSSSAILLRRISNATIQMYATRW